MKIANCVTNKFWWCFFFGMWDGILRSHKSPWREKLKYKKNSLILLPSSLLLFISESRLWLSFCIHRDFSLSNININSLLLHRKLKKFLLCKTKKNKSLQERQWASEEGGQRKKERNMKANEEIYNSIGNEKRILCE